MKFEWTFSISGDQKDLEISLNGGVNVLLEIEHEKFYQYLSEKMAEIWYFQHTLGTENKVGKCPSHSDSLADKKSTGIFMRGGK